MIEVKDLTKVFRGSSKKAVDSTSFSVRKGEIVGLLGENGAGKTTMLRMIATMLRPTSGTASVDGFDVCLKPEQVRSRIGILFGGEAGLYDRLTARENIRYFADLNSVPRNISHENIKRISRLLGMDDYIDKRAGKLSKGMKQKTALARSIVHNPSIMLFDEPTAGLDVTSAKIVRDFITDCRKENKAILFSSHNMEEAEELCDRIVVIHQGKILEDRTIPELKSAYGGKLENIFLKMSGENL